MIGANWKTSVKGEGRGVREQGRTRSNFKMPEFGDSMVKENFDSVLPSNGVRPSFDELAEMS